MLVVKKKESDAVFKRFTNGCVRVVNRIQVEEVFL